MTNDVLIRVLGFIACVGVTLVASGTSTALALGAAAGIALPQLYLWIARTATKRGSA